MAIRQTTATMVTVAQLRYGICQFWGWKRTSSFAHEEDNAGIVCTNQRRPRCVSWYQTRSSHTTAYEEYLLNSTIEDVSLKENIGCDAVVGAHKRQVDVELNWSEVEDLRTGGIDEIVMKKGCKNYAAIVTGGLSNGQVRVLAVLPD